MFRLPKDYLNSIQIEFFFFLFKISNTLYLLIFPFEFMKEIREEQWRIEISLFYE